MQGVGGLLTRQGAPSLFASGTVLPSLRYKAQPSGIYFLVRDWKVCALELSFISFGRKIAPSNHGSLRLKVRNKMVTANREHQSTEINS